MMSKANGKSTSPTTPRASAACTAEQAAAITFPAEPKDAAGLRKALATMPIADADRTSLIAAAIVLDHDDAALTASVAREPAAFLEVYHCLWERTERFEGLAELCRSTAARLLVALSRYEIERGGGPGA